MCTPRISVVTSVYNCEKYIGETIQSVIDQTYTSWEYILIDDNSTDKSVEVIESFHDSRIKLIKNEKNKGQCANLNFGISLAQGEYIARLDHDDVCMPTRFEKQLEYMDNNSQVVLCGCWISQLIEQNVVALENIPIKANCEEEFMLALMNNDRIAHSSFFIRRQAMLTNDVWYGDYKWCEDYALLLSILRFGEIGFVDEVLVLYRIFPEQTTQNQSRAMQMQEEIDAVNVYWELSDFPQKEILMKACKGELSSWKDYRDFNKGVILFALYLHLGRTKKDIGSLQSVCSTYLKLLRKQKRNVNWVMARIINSYK